MPSKKDIEKRVLEFFRKRWPSATRGSKLREDLLLDDDDIVDIGTELAEELGSEPTRTQIRKCQTIGNLTDLLIDTRPGKKPAKKKKKTGGA